MTAKEKKIARSIVFAVVTDPDGTKRVTLFNDCKSITRTLTKQQAKHLKELL
jgi:hypothetical protein